MKSDKNRLHKMGIDQCLEEVIIKGLNPDIFFCILKVGHKGFHTIVIEDKAVDVIRKTTDARERKFNKLEKKFNKKQPKDGDYPQHYKW